MPCHVPSARVPKNRLHSSLRVSPPHILATLDLSKKSERDAQAFLKRACSGRWPMWRMFGMRRRESTLFVAVEWLRCGTKERYSVVELSLREPAVCWRAF